jgi:hypothetical protein
VPDREEGRRRHGHASEEHCLSVVIPQNKRGISDICDQKAKQAYFEPVTVGGYPGVFADSQDGRASGSCTLLVGEAMIAHLKGAA